MKAFLGLMTLLVLILSGCRDASTIVIYTDRHYASDDAIYDAFEASTNSSVEILSASADELIQRLISEGDNTPADLLFLTDVGRLERAEAANLFQPMDSDLIAAVPGTLKHPESLYTGVTVRARILVYHPDRISANQLSTYEALGEPSFADQIVIRSSQNVYNQSLFASLLAIHGEPAFDAWLLGLKDNLARRPAGNDRDQAKAVFSGEADVAIMNTYYMGKMAFSDNPYEREVAQALDVFFPNQETTGTHVNISGIGLVKASNNQDLAEQLIAYLVSTPVQNVFAATNYEYPVIPGATVHPYIAAWGDFRPQDLPLFELGNWYQKVSIKVDEIGFDQ